MKESTIATWYRAAVTGSSAATPRGLRIPSLSQSSNGPGSNDETQVDGEEEHDPPGGEPPAARQEPAVREQQEHEEQEREERRECSRADEREGPEPRDSSRMIEPVLDDAVARSCEREAEPDSEQQPSDRVARLSSRDEGADGGERETTRTTPGGHLGEIAVADGRENAADDDERESGSEPHPGDRGPPHRGTSRSHSDACAGCIVSVTTPRRSCSSVPEVDLLAQPRAEALERALGVVAAAVEAAVDEPLHPRAHREEERCHDECRCRDRQVRAAGERREQRLPREHEAHVRTAEHHRQRTVDECPRDQAVDLVQAVAEHGDPDRDRCQAHREERQRLDEGLRLRRQQRASDPEDSRDSHGPGEPLHLQPLNPPRVPEPNDQRENRADCRDEEQRHKEGDPVRCKVEHARE